MLPPRRTRAITVRHLPLGAQAPIAVQSMAATQTADLERTLEQVAILEAAGADIIRLAVDSRADLAAMERIRPATDALLCVDLQESYRLAADLAPLVDKLRYNPGHLHHHEPTRPVADKVAWLADQAANHNCALRIGVNAGSFPPEYAQRFADDHVAAAVQCALDHCDLIEQSGFTNFVVSLKDSDPRLVIEANQRFAAQRPDVPLHLGVTEAGLPPDGVIKTRIAFEQLLSQGLGDTLRVSLTVPFAEKGMEIEVGRQMLRDIAAGRFRSVPQGFFDGLNIIACPSCSRVENDSFVALAEEVKRTTTYAADEKITIAVMGCRVNGPGETDNADLGLWCGPRLVTLKRGARTIGSWPFAEVLEKLHTELRQIVAERACPTTGQSGE